MEEEKNVDFGFALYEDSFCIWTGNDALALRYRNLHTIAFHQEPDGPEIIFELVDRRTGHIGDHRVLPVEGVLLCDILNACCQISSKLDSH